MMTCDLWTRLAFTGFVCIIVGLIIFGVSQTKSELGEAAGGFIAFAGALTTLISVFGIIWTA